MTFGCSYAADIFVNGQKVFQGDAPYISRDIQFGRAQRAGAGGGGALKGGDFDPGRASAYISHAMALYRPHRSSPTV